MNPRIASDTPRNETMGVRSIRRWAVVRLVLGLLQTIGAAVTLALFLYSGITPLALASVIVTGTLAGISILLFQVWKCGQQKGDE